MSDHLLAIAKKLKNKYYILEFIKVPFAAATKPAYSTTSAYTGATRQVSQTTQAKTNYTGTYQAQTPQPVAATYSTTYSNTPQQQQTAAQTQTKAEKKPAKYIPASTASYQTQTATQVTPSAATSTSAYSTSYTTPQVQQQSAAAPIQTTSAGKINRFKLSMSLGASI